MNTRSFSADIAPAALTPLVLSNRDFEEQASQELNALEGLLNHFTTVALIPVLNYHASGLLIDRYVLDIRMLTEVLLDTCYVFGRSILFAQAHPRPASRFVLHRVASAAHLWLRPLRGAFRGCRLTLCRLSGFCWRGHRTTCPSCCLATLVCRAYILTASVT